MGGFGLFFYPPPFALLILPVALLPTDVAVWTWTGLLIAATVAAIGLLPVSLRTRLIVLLLAALSWPLLYAIKLGQVGPVLLLLFAVGWRWLDKPWPLGLAAGLGTVIKLQPALLIGWMAVTGRRRAALIAVGLIAVLAAVATVIAGPQVWGEWMSLLGRASRPVLAENDTGFGRLAYLAGAPEAVAVALHYLNVALVVIVTTFAVLRASPIASYLAVVVASQFVSPVLWDHYALILLLPVAWLVERGRLWAVLIPLATATFLTGVTPVIAYPVLFWITLLAVTWEGVSRRRGQTLRAQGSAVGSILGG
jgi:alpha-1,2-mannosyltransferase